MYSDFLIQELYIYIFKRIINMNFNCLWSANCHTTSSRISQSEMCFPARFSGDNTLHKQSFNHAKRIK
jgi:hypothetical protein